VTQHHRALYGLLTGDYSGTWVGLEQRMLNFSRRQLTIHYFCLPTRRHLADGGYRHIANHVPLTYCADTRRWQCEIEGFELPPSSSYALGEVAFHLLWRFLAPEIRQTPIDVHVTLPWPSAGENAAHRLARNRFWSTVLDHEHAGRNLVCHNVVAGNITGRLRDPMRASPAINHTLGYFPLDISLWPEPATMPSTLPNSAAATPCHPQDHRWDSRIITRGVDSEGRQIHAATCSICGTSAFEHGTGEPLRNRFHVDRHSCITQDCAECQPPRRPHARTAY